MGWTIAGTLIRYMKGRVRDQALAKRAEDAGSRRGAGRVKDALRGREVRKGDTGGRTARREWRKRAGKVHEHKA